MPTKQHGQIRGYQVHYVRMVNGEPTGQPVIKDILIDDAQVRHPPQPGTSSLRHIVSLSFSHLYMSYCKDIYCALQKQLSPISTAGLSKIVTVLLLSLLTMITIALFSGVYIFSPVVSVCTWTLSVVFFLSIFLYHNQWEFDDSTEHVSS